MDWKVEVRLIKADGKVAEGHTWQKALDQISANALYNELVAELRKKYPSTQP